MTGITKIIKLHQKQTNKSKNYVEKKDHVT